MCEQKQAQIVFQKLRKIINMGYLQYQIAWATPHQRGKHIIDDVIDVAQVPQLANGPSFTEVAAVEAKA